RLQAKGGSPSRSARNTRGWLLAPRRESPRRGEGACFYSGHTGVASPGAPPRSKRARLLTDGNCAGGRGVIRFTCRPPCGRRSPEDHNAISPRPGSGRVLTRCQAALRVRGSAKPDRKSVVEGKGAGAGGRAGHEEKAQ